MSNQKKRKIYTEEFKTEALKLADKIGVSATAKELNVYDPQIYNWKAAAQKKARPVNEKQLWQPRSPS